MRDGHIDGDTDVAETEDELDEMTSVNEHVEWMNAVVSERDYARAPKGISATYVPKTTAESSRVGGYRDTPVRAKTMPRSRHNGGNDGEAIQATESSPWEMYWRQIKGQTSECDVREGGVGDGVGDVACKVEECDIGYGGEGVECNVEGCDMGYGGDGAECNVEECDIGYDGGECHEGEEDACDEGHTCDSDVAWTPPRWNGRKSCDARYRRGNKVWNFVTRTWVTARGSTRRGGKNERARRKEQGASTHAANAVNSVLSGSRDGDALGTVHRLYGGACFADLLS